MRYRTALRKGLYAEAAALFPAYDAAVERATTVLAWGLWATFAGICAHLAAVLLP